MSGRRLFSSEEIINALIRCGFELTGRRGKSHQTLKRPRAGGRSDVTVVPMGKKEIPKGTLDSILQLGNLDYHDFLECAKVKRKGRKRRDE
jgi:predicted RNA binding protein YcfA (HicA-like mRNA interferase family)